MKIHGPNFVIPSLDPSFTPFTQKWRGRFKIRKLIERWLQFVKSWVITVKSGEVTAKRKVRS